MIANSIKIKDTDLTFSRVVTGVWKWGDLSTEQILQLIQDSIAYGVTTFDHADIYGGYTIEEQFGKALAQAPHLREKMQLVSKCGIKLTTPNRPSHNVKSYDTSDDHIMLSVENSLKALHTDHLDLLLIHRPDPLMQVDEVAETFTKLRKQGKVLHFGVSNFTPSQFDMLNSRVKLVANQVEISVLKDDTLWDGTLDQCQKLGVSPMAWSPLGSGRVFTELNDPNIQRLRAAAEAIGAKYQNAGIDQVLLAWLMKHPANILPVLGTTKSERIKAAAEATHINMSREEWFTLLEAAKGQQVP